ncbi:hypothetical protein ACFFMR_00535 [Micromonospora andamanensis]|uniref:Uncharacterized protein n=1 Tax=Micromonospora andamanensis TaxID=1287068 RepID=A0ABQ4HTK7_9ACTN|nr:hypothetical protein [Micromonospora andamanensis]GIJ08972.1 hypothetical protein Van01_21860 [Micromonospora andamanensis]
MLPGDRPDSSGTGVGQAGLVEAAALLAPPEEPPEDPLPEPDEAEPDEAEPDDEEPDDEEFAPVELEDDDSDLPLDPLDVVSEPEERESVR